MNPISPNTGNRVFGKVLVKETGEGIPNLVVALFDADPTSLPSSAGPSSTAPPSALAGNRIGSVLTDTNGDFELTFDDAIFAAGDPERRPDLILGVFAPEDRDLAGQATSQPPQQRLLIFSDVQRRDAGRIEAYVLRVPRELLKRYGIPTKEMPVTPVPEVLAQRLVDAQVSQEKLKDLVRQGLAPLRQARVKRSREIVAASKSFVRRLGAAPLAIRNRPTFVGPECDLASAQRTAMENGLTALKNREKQPRRPLLYHLSRQDFAAAGIVIANQPAAPEFATPGMIYMEPAPVYALTHEQMCNLIGRRRRGTALERVLDLVEARKQAADGQRRVEEATAPEDEEGGEEAEGGGQPEQPPAQPTTEETLTAGILGQLRDLTVPEAAPAASIEELSARLTGFSLPPGPADVTSFHDFHQLQIAFEHVWTEAFDESLREAVQELYGESVRLHDEFGVPHALPVELAESRQVEGLLRDLGRDLAHLSEETKAGEAVASRRQGGQPPPPPARRAEQPPPPASQAGDEPPPRVSDLAPRLIRLLDETRLRLSEPYAFHYFAPNSVNFAILVTYRQKWEPLTYQVGDLVGTIPLAPGESRKITTRTVIKRTRAQKEIEKALSSRSGESSMTQRADAEITAKASTTTNFRQTAQGSFDIGIGSLAASTEFVLNQALESASVKKDFREAVIKAAQEYKQERTLEVETTQEATAETTTSGEISNVNNEVTVTYLLYELERQYRISERIHRVTPVILVAQDVPGPHEITESWLLAHEWILRRVLLDDGLRPALDQLKESFAGDELSVSIKRQNWETQKGIVETLEGTVSTLKASREGYRTSLLDQEEAMKLAKAADDAEGFLINVAEALSADVTEARAEFLKAGVQKVQKQLEFLQESLNEAEQKLARARESLDSATKAYTEAIEAQTNRRVAIDQLRVHVKENILYYMQAIWDHEPPDQRFFRLYYQQVDLPEANDQTCQLRRATEEELASGIETIGRGGEFYVVEGCEAPVLPDEQHPNTKRLVEIADLDHPLGYKGNYIIFPLKTCVYLTEFMMKQFIDGYFGVRDPDEAGNFTTDELLTCLESIWNDLNVTLSEAERAALRDLVLRRVREPRRDSDLVVVPTGQIYIEALLGGHPLLEPFKLIHRAYDVGKARAELRQSELENLRRAARLLAGEREDPDIDKRVLVQGNAGVVAEPD